MEYDLDTIDVFKAAMQPVASQNDGDGNNVDQDTTGDDGDGPATENGTDNTTSG